MLPWHPFTPTLARYASHPKGEASRLPSTSVSWTCGTESSTYWVLPLCWPGNHSNKWSRPPGWSTYSCKAWLPRSLLAPSAPERHPCMALHGGPCPLTAGVSSVTDKLLSRSSVRVWGSRVHVSNYVGWRIPPSPTRWIRSGSEQGGLEAYHTESSNFASAACGFFSLLFFLLLRKQY